MSTISEAEADLLLTNIRLIMEQRMIPYEQAVTIYIKEVHNEKAVSAGIKDNERGAEMERGLDPDPGQPD